MVVVVENATKPSRFAHFWQGPQSLAHLNLRKWSVHGVFCTFLTSKCASRHNRVHFFDISTSKSGPYMVCFVHFDLEMCFAPQRRALFSTSQLPKVVRPWCVLYMFTSKSASRHNGVHFFDISTSKTAPNPSVFNTFTSKCASRHNAVHFFVLRTPSVFNTFYFQICFAPQRRALFQHLNFQKWSDAEVFCTFSLRNRLRATTACNFSSLISPDVSALAALASLLFNPPEPQNHEKTQCFATFLPFRAPASSFFWSFLFWLFSLLTAFSSLHIVGSLTPKLPSIMLYFVFACMQ